MAAGLANWTVTLMGIVLAIMDAMDEDSAQLLHPAAKHFPRVT